MSKLSKFPTVYREEKTMNQESINTTFEEKRRTISQNNALHLWFEQVAKILNEEGKTMKMVLDRFIVDTPATKYTIKELLWKPLQEVMFGKDSTTQLSKKEEIDKVYDALNKFFAEEMEISVPPFPSEEEVYHRKTQGNL